MNFSLKEIAKKVINAKDLMRLDYGQTNKNRDVKNLIYTRNVKMEMHVNSYILHQNARCTKDLSYVMTRNANLNMWRMRNRIWINLF